MRRNWTQIFGGVSDIAATLLGCIVAGDTAWADLHFIPALEMNAG